MDTWMIVARWCQVILTVGASAIVVPLGLDLHVPVPESNPLTAAKIQLGQRLFNDAGLSRDSSIACVTCHDPIRAFADGRALAVGINGRLGRRNTPAIINRGYGRVFFWDGRETSLEAQVLKPIEDRDEMDSTVASAAARVGLSPVDLANALASYVRSILSGNSRFDRFVNGERDALSADEQAGLQVFRGRGGCTACHVAPTFTDEQFHNTGVAWRQSTDRSAGGYQDEGRFGVTDRQDDRGAFKTPTVRDVERTGPYMHDGSLRSLEDVVEFYNHGGRSNPNLDTDIRPLRLTADDKSALVAFLKTLSGSSPPGRSPASPTPSGRSR